MTDLVQTNSLIWKEYETEILTEKILKDFLMSESIPCLSSRFKNPEEFYENLLFKIPGIENHKKFKMIYSHLVEFYPHNYLDKAELEKKHNITEEKILAEGSVKLLDTSLENAPMVRWLIIKSE